MSKAKFRFNPETLEYEKVSNSILLRIGKIFGFTSLAIISGITTYLILNQDQTTEQLKNQLVDYQIQVKLLEQKSGEMQSSLDELASMDDNVYREIFGADPIEDDIRKAGTGGVNKYISLEQFQDGNKIKALHMRLDNMKNQSKIQKDSYSKLIQMAQDKSKMLASIPAIQPIPNKTLKRIASGFGYRVDPIYKTRKMHKGLDFSAPKGTKIYATGDGVIHMVKRDRWGYGTHIIIDHGYGYTTLYGHMSKASVKKGENVKRGQVIGLVGSTGKSTGPHLHYEVAKNGVQVNPVGYFYNDLTSDQYEEIVKLSSNPNQSFD